MRRSLVFLLTVPMFAHAADTARAPKEQTLGKKEETTLDKSLAGDITRKKEEQRPLPRSSTTSSASASSGRSPTSAASRSTSLQKIIELSGDSKETP